MAKKLKFYETWDLKSVFAALGMAAFLGLLAIIYFAFPSFSNRYQLSKLDGTTNGLIIQADEQIIFAQSLLGNRPKIDHYTIEFTYQVNEKSFTNTCMVDETKSNRDKLKRILSTTDSSVVVKFMTLDPANSMIDLSGE